MDGRNCIRISTTVFSHKVGLKTHRNSHQRITSRIFHRSRKRLIRYGLLTGNVVLLAVAVIFVSQQSGPQVVNRNAVVGADSTVAVNPLDQLSSVDIAVHIARMASLPESTAVVNQADTVNNQIATVSADDQIIAKPQVVATAQKSRKDIQSYVVAPGDTLASLAAKFGITSDSIKWSNNITGGTVQVGQELIIPPVPGIVYTVKAGDTPEKLAKDYNASQDNLIFFNDIELSGLPVGAKIVIPDGTKPQPMYVATAAYSGGSGFAWGGSKAVYGYNGYDYGWCTWYAASKVAVPANWGNANTWDSGARASGWTVSKIPRAGAVAQTDAMSYLGHVAYVEAVSEDGTKIKYSDMNGLSGWGRVGYSDWVPASTYQNYIYR